MDSTMKFKQDIEVWYGVIKRAVIVGGLMLFSGAVASQCWNYEQAFIAGGIYMFAELAKNYKIDMTKQSKSTYLLFP